MALSRRATVLIGLVWLLAVIVVVVGVAVIVFGFSWLASRGSWPL